MDSRIPSAVVRENLNPRVLRETTGQTPQPSAVWDVHAWAGRPDAERRTYESWYQVDGLISSRFPTTHRSTGVAEEPSEVARLWQAYAAEDKAFADTLPALTNLYPSSRLKRH